ncbi:MAG: hypothetical protein WAV20_24920, partial [Blastocatellia bacterium]
AAEPKAAHSGRSPPGVKAFGTAGGEAAQSARTPSEGKALRHRGRRSRSVAGPGCRGQSPSAQTAAKPLSREGLGFPRAEPFGTDGGEAAQSKGLLPEGRALRHRGRRSRSP